MMSATAISSLLPLLLLLLLLPPGAHALVGGLPTTAAQRDSGALSHLVHVTAVGGVNHRAPYKGTPTHTFSYILSYILSYNIRQKLDKNSTETRQKLDRNHGKNYGDCSGNKATGPVLALKQGHGHSPGSPAKLLVGAS